MKKLSAKQERQLNLVSSQVLNEGLFGFQMPTQLSNPESNPIIGLANMALRRGSAYKNQQAQIEAGRQEQARVSGVKRSQHDATIKALSDKVLNPQHPEYHSGNNPIVRAHLENAINNPANADMHHAQAIKAAGLPNPLHENAGAAAVTGALAGAATGDRKERPKGILGNIGSEIKKASLSALLKPIMVPTLGTIASIGNAQLRRANISNYLKGIGAAEQ